MLIRDLNFIHEWISRNNHFLIHSSQSKLVCFIQETGKNRKFRTMWYIPLSLVLRFTERVKSCNDNYTLVRIQEFNESKKSIKFIRAHLLCKKSEWSFAITYHTFLLSFRDHRLRLFVVRDNGKSEPLGHLLKGMVSSGCQRSYMFCIDLDCVWWTVSSWIGH